MKNLTKQQAIILIRTLCSHLEKREFTVEHVGEYDINGNRHADAIQVINFNQREQITIWNTGIRYYQNGHALLSKNEFLACSLLQKWGVIQPSAELLLAVEFGFISGEKGNNLDKTLIDFKNTYNGGTVISSQQ